MRRLTLCIFPTVAICLAFVAAILQAEDVRLWWGGKRSVGTVSGMLVVRPGQVDLLDTFATDLVVRLSDGQELRASYLNHAVIPAVEPSTEPNSPATLARGTQPTTATAVDARIKKMMNDAARGNAFDIRGMLQREKKSALAGPRIVWVEKRERGSGLLNLSALPTALTPGPEGIELKGGETRGSGSRGEVLTFAVFDASDPVALRERNGEFLVEYEQKRDGVVTNPAKKDFALYCEPYATEFRPIFSYAVAGKTYAGLSDVGRHGGPTLAIRLFEPCWAFYSDERPQSATLVAKVGDANGERLLWFSRLCEGLFSQWGMPFLIAFAASMFAIMGGLIISLAVFPPKATIAALASDRRESGSTAGG